MRRYRKTLSVLLLLCFTLPTIFGCGSGRERQETGKKQETADTQVTGEEPAAEEKQPEVETVDLFTKDLRLNVEHTYREDDPHVLVAIANDGHTGLFISSQQGETPELRDLDSGKKTKITLSEFRIEDTEEACRKAVLFSAQRMISNKDKLAEFEEKLNSLHGFDIFKSGPFPLMLQSIEYCLTSAENDFLFVRDNNYGFGGALDIKTGVLYPAFRDEGGTFEPYSAIGTKILGRYNVINAAIFDTADFSFRVMKINDTFGYKPKGDKWVNTCNNLAYLKDGSMAAIITEQSYVEKEMYEEDWLCILRPDGGTEQYMIGDIRNSTGYRIISNDPDYVIAEPFSMGITTPRLVNRKTGEVSALKVEGIRLVSVSLENAKDLKGAAIAIQIIDVLKDGRTLILRDGSTGTLALFRPDSMETKIVWGDGYTALCMNFTGDHRGRMCATYMTREYGNERGILLTIVDKNGDPIF